MYRSVINHNIIRSSYRSALVFVTHNAVSPFYSILCDKSQVTHLPSLNRVFIFRSRDTTTVLLNINFPNPPRGHTTCSPFAVVNRNVYSVDLAGVGNDNTGTCKSSSACLCAIALPLTPNLNNFHSTFNL